MTSESFTYELPDGTRIKVAADLCKGAASITFELQAVPPATRGRIVDAVLVGGYSCSRCARAISATQVALSLMRADGAVALCKDCITRELTIARNGGRS